MDQAACLSTQPQAPELRGSGRRSPAGSRDKSPWRGGGAEPRHGTPCPDNRISAPHGALVGSIWRDLPGSRGSSLDFDSGVAAFEPSGAFMRWKVRHNVAGTHWIRLRIKVFLKARASLDVERDRREAQRDATALASWAPSPVAVRDPTAEAATRAAAREVARSLVKQGLSVRALLGQGN